MKSAIKTLEKKLRDLKVEVGVWSDPRQYCERTVILCKQEIKEHEEALKLLKGK